MRRITRLALAAMLGVLVLLGSVGLVAWRLAAGPIPLDVLTPYLEDALRGEAGAPTVTIGATQLAWDAGVHRPELRAVDVRVTGPDGNVLLAVPALAVRASLPALLRGRVVLTTIEAIEPRLDLVRGADGAIALGTGPRLPGTGDGEGPSPLARLRRLTIRQAALTLLDRPNGRLWRIPRADVEVHRERAGLAGHLTGTLATSEREVPLDVSATSHGAPRRTELRLRVHGLVPATLATEGAADPQDPLGRALARVTLPLDATVDLTLDDALRPMHAALDVAGTAGTLAVRDIVGLDLAVDRARLVARADSGGLVVDELTLGLGDLALQAQGRLTGREDPRALEVQATLARLATDDLGRWWPPIAVPAARRWVTTHIGGGLVRDVQARLTGTVHTGDAAGLEVTDVRATCAFDGLTVTWLDGMPPVTEIAGTATFARAGGDFAVTGGQLAGVEVVRATVRIPWAAEPPRVVVDAQARGPLASALATLDHEPLRLVTPIGIAPQAVGGTVETRVGVDVPLVEPVEPAVTAKATLAGVTIAHFIRDWSIAGGSLALALDPDGLAVTGDVRVEGVPAHVAVRQERGEGAGRTIEVQGRIDRAGRVALGLDPGAWADGPMDVTARVVHHGAEPGTLALDVGLRDTTLDLPLLALVKPAGTPGRATARLTLAGDAVTAVDAAELVSGGTTLRGSATRTPDGERWQTVDVHATLAPRPPATSPARATIAVRPAGTTHRLTLAADDAGTLLRALVAEGEVDGGALGFEGTVDLATADFPFQGHLTIDRFRLVQAPWLLRVATVASLGGLVDPLSRDGVAFDQLTADLAWHRPVLTLTDAAARGRTLSLTLAGTSDRDAGTLDLKGTLIPSYFGLNEAPGRIPVVGEMLTGGALQAFAFEVTGPAADPKVSVNPLASLAPGALRKLLP